MKYTVMEGRKKILEHATGQEVRDKIGIRKHHIPSYALHGYTYAGKYKIYRETESEELEESRKADKRCLSTEDKLVSEWEEVCKPFRKLARKRV